MAKASALKEPDDSWASYDVLDVWYQQADYGEVWVPYLHVRTTPAAGGMVEGPSAAMPAVPDQSMPIADFLAKFEGEQEHENRETQPRYQRGNLIDQRSATAGSKG